MTQKKSRLREAKNPRYIYQKSFQVGVNLLRLSLLCCVAAGRVPGTAVPITYYLYIKLRQNFVLKNSILEMEQLCLPASPSSLLYLMLVYSRPNNTDFCSAICLQTACKN